MKVVLFPVVKKLHDQKIMRAWRWIRYLPALLMCAIVAHPAWAGSLQVGGAPGRARVVFDLDRPVAPVIVPDDQTLIVKFPDIVGEPTSVSETFIIQHLLFDGKTASIFLKKPFSYTTTTLERPPRFIIDLADRDDLPQDTCPIEHIETSPHDNGITLTFSINPELWPEIRYNQDKRVYFLFDGNIRCADMDKELARTPYIEYSGTIKTQKGVGLIFSLAQERASLEVTTDEINNKIILEITTTEQLSRSRMYSMARSSFDDGDIASAIHSLDRYKDSLDPEESVLLGRAYWRISYPYRMESMSLDAMKFMSDGIQAMTPGPARELAMLEYTGMLLRSNMYTEAANYIRFLKESTSDDIAARAHIQEIDVMNKKGLFEDAFVQDKRMRSIFNPDTLSGTDRGYYFLTAGDTYLGLNAHEKALRLYRQALEEDPSLFSYDPDIYSRIAEASYRLNDYAGAREYILLAINLGNPANKAMNLLKLGDCLYQLGQPDQAIGVFAEVENIAPRSDSGIIAKLRTARIKLEQDLAENGDLSDKAFYEIMDIYESLKTTEEYQEGPLGALVRIRIAQTFSRKGDWDNALDAYYRAWLDTKKDDPIHQYAQAEGEKTIVSRLKTLSGEEHYDAIYDLYTQYQDSFMTDIRDSDSLFILGDALYRVGYQDQARPLLVTCTEGESGRREQALAILFTMDYRQADYAGALLWNTRYLESYPEGAEAASMRDTRGELLYHMNALEEAIGYLEPLTSRGDDTSLVALAMLADIYKRLGRTDKEIATLEEIIAAGATTVSPIVEQALYSRAKQLIASGDLRQAEELLDEMIAAYPQSPYRYWALYHLAQIGQSLGDAGGARTLLAEVIQGTTDTVLLNAAITSQKELDLHADINDYNMLKNRFGGN